MPAHKVVRGAWILLAALAVGGCAAEAPDDELGFDDVDDLDDGDGGDLGQVYATLAESWRIDFGSIDTVGYNNLGTAYAGQTVRVRFRIGADEATNEFGWELDDLAFSNLTNEPFLEVVPDPDACSLVSVDAPLPREASLALASASPIDGPARFRFALPAAGPVDLAIYDVVGRRVATLADGPFDAGVHTATWNEGGARHAGVYFARLIAGGHTFARRLVVLN